jgi:hypothetical protein
VVVRNDLGVLADYKIKESRRCNQTGDPFLDPLDEILASAFEPKPVGWSDRPPLDGYARVGTAADAAREFCT